MQRVTSREKSKELRSHSTAAESVLWKMLRCKQLDGLKFRRQYDIGGFILDFYCPQLGLGIELDGQSHVGQEYKDEFRSFKLSEEHGISILRFENRVVFEQPHSIIQSIKLFAEEHPLRWQKRNLRTTTTIVKSRCRLLIDRF